MARLTLEVTDANGQQAELEVRIRRDSVEFWRDEHCRGVFDRDVLRDWLEQPDGAIAVDDLTFAPAGDRISVSLDGVLAWWLLEPLALAVLRSHL